MATGLRHCSQFRHLNFSARRSFVDYCGTRVFDMYPYFRRSGQSQCEEGTFCLGGRRRQCPAGTFGATTGLMSSACSGPCPAGSYCPAGTIDPIPCPAGSYGGGYLAKSVIALQLLKLTGQRLVAPNTYFERLQLQVLY